MDDTSDKLRRNTVVLSAAIIGAWWLQLKVPGQLKVLGIADGLALPAPSRVWVAIAVVHLYCFLRYFFSPEATKGRRAWQNQRHAMTRDRIKKLLRTQARSYPDITTWASCFASLAPPAEMTDGFTINGTGGSGWNGTLSVVWKVVDDSGKQVKIGRCEYSVPWLLRMRIRIATWRDMIITTHDALESLWPVLFFAIASTVIATRFGELTLPAPSCWLDATSPGVPAGSVRGLS